MLDVVDWLDAQGTVEARAAQDEIERLRAVLRKLQKVRYLYSTYASGASRQSYGQMIDDSLRHIPPKDR